MFQINTGKILREIKGDMNYTDVKGGFLGVAPRCCLEQIYFDALSLSWKNESLITTRQRQSNLRLCYLVQINALSLQVHEITKLLEVVAMSERMQSKVY